MIRTEWLTRRQGIRALLLLACLASCREGERTKKEGPKAPASAPMRVLPTTATAVDIVFDLIDPSRIVAVPNTIHEFATVEWDPDDWRGERVFKEFSAETLLAFDPDLVIASPWQDQSTIDRLIESGVGVFELPAVAELADVRVAITQAGVALHAEARAAELLAEFDRRLVRLQQSASKRGRLRGLVYTNYGSGGWSAGSGTTAHQMLELAGITNVAAQAGRVGHDGVDIETLLDLDPDIIVISKPSRTYGVTRAYLEGEPALANLEAVARGRIVEMPAALFSTASHNLLVAAEELVRGVEALVADGTLDPEAFSSKEAGGD